jgi:hypothetical protein
MSHGSVGVTQGENYGLGLADPLVSHRIGGDGQTR